MKRVIILLIGLFCIFQPALTKEPYWLKEEVLEYKLKWSLLGVDILSPTAGWAFLVCQKAAPNGYELTFHGYSTGVARFFKKINNLSKVYLDHTGLVQEINNCFTDSTLEKWDVDYSEGLIYHYLGEGDDSDTMTIDGHLPNNPLSAIYLLRNSQLQLNTTINLSIVGHDSLGRKTAWKPATIFVTAIDTLKVQGDKIACWRLIITLDPRDNLFPGGNITLWVTADKMLVPVEVETDFYLLGRHTVRGKLVSQLKKDD